MRRTLAVLLILISVPLFAQDGDWYVGQTIRDIRFVGLSTVSEAELESIVDPYIGESFTDRRFLELQRRLYALDFFTSVLPEAIRPESGDGVIIRFTVEERPTVDEVRFTGNRRIRTTDLLSEIILSEGDMITLAKRRVDEQAILDLYLERGYPDVEVSSLVEEADEEGERRFTLIFTISEGQRVTVREINFSGNSFASASTLRGQMETKAQSIFNPGVYQDRILEEDKLRIEDYYRQRGHVDAQVVEVAEETELDEEDERTYIVLTVYIEEGSQYTFGDITFEGNTIFDDEELAALIREREGSVLNAVRLQEGIAQVQDLYYQNGYIFNGFNVTEQRDEQALTIAYTVQISEQPRAHIENIIIRGNEKTLDEVILREIPLQVGDVFSVSRIREGVQNLNNLQFFSAINPETPQGSVEGLMDLIINVEEAQTADVTFGVSFGGSQQSPVSGQFGWSDRNFLGRGQTLGAQVQASPTQQAASVNFLERWFADQRWSLGGDFTVNHTIREGELQDILTPIFDGDDLNAVPDPYHGYLVFTEDNTEYPAGSGVFFDAGDVFPGTLEDAGVDANANLNDLIPDGPFKLMTDYAYANLTDGNDEANLAVTDDYLTTYSRLSLSLGGNTGYRFRTSLGTLALSTSLRTSFERVFYNEELVRPYSASVRENRTAWETVNRWNLNGTLDRRRGLYLSPSSGYVVSQDVGFTGGFLFGDRHYIRTDTTAEAFFTLWDVPVFETWNWKTVLAMHSELSLVLPTFWVPARFEDLDQPITDSSDLLATNQMFIARGWTPQLEKRALWNNWIELRTPIAEQVIWADAFFDAVAPLDAPSELGSFDRTDMLFGIGAGLRFTIPQFPIRVYLVKRFKIDETSGRLAWQEGTLFTRDDKDNGGLDFVFALGADLF